MGNEHSIAFVTMLQHLVWKTPSPAFHRKMDTAALAITICLMACTSTVTVIISWLTPQCPSDPSKFWIRHGSYWPPQTTGELHCPGFHSHYLHNQSQLPAICPDPYEWGPNHLLAQLLAHWTWTMPPVHLPCNAWIADDTWAQTAEMPPCTKLLPRGTMQALQGHLPKNQLGL